MNTNSLTLSASYTFNGDAATVVSLMGHINETIADWFRASGMTVAPDGTITSSPAEAEGGPQALTDADVKALWDGIKPDAKRVLAQMAKQPEGYPKAQLYQDLGMDGRAVGGALSSMGVRERQLDFRGKKARLYTWDGTSGVEKSVMVDAVANAIRVLAAAEGL